MLVEVGVLEIKGLTPGRQVCVWWWEGIGFGSYGLLTNLCVMVGGYWIWKLRVIDKSVCDGGRVLDLEVKGYWQVCVWWWEGIGFGSYGLLTSLCVMVGGYWIWKLRVIDKSVCDGGRVLDLEVTGYWQVCVWWWEGIGFGSYGLLTLTSLCVMVGGYWIWKLRVIDKSVCDGGRVLDLEVKGYWQVCVWWWEGGRSHKTFDTAQPCHLFKAKLKTFLFSQYFHLS